MIFEYWRQLLGAFLYVVLLGACAVPSPQTDEASASVPLPDDPNALILGAEVALQRSQVLEATRAYVRAAQLSDDESLSEQATRIAYEHRQWSLVEAATQRWLTLNSTSEDAHRYAGAAALHMYRIDTAAEHFDALLQTSFISPEAGFLALLPQISGESSSAAALAVLQRMAEKYLDEAEAHYAVAQAAIEGDHFALALQHAERARELAPYWTPAGMLLARLQVMLKKTDQGLATARSVLEQDPQGTHKLEYAILVMAAGQEEAGRQALQALASEEATAAAAQRALALVEYQTGQHDSAAQRFNALLTSGRFVYEAQFYLGAIAEARQETEEALHAYERVTAGVYAVPAQTRAARIKAREGGKEAAIASLQEFATNRPQYAVQVIQAQSTVLDELGDPDAAMALLERGLREYPDATELRFARVFLLESRDKVKDAVQELRELVNERPADPAALNALGYTLVDRTRHDDEGLQLIEQALALTPDNGAVLDSMGWALHKAGRHEEGLEYLERARQRIQDPEVEFHVGAVLAALGRKDAARQVWQSAAERFPEHQRLQERVRKTR